MSVTEQRIRTKDVKKLNVTAVITLTMSTTGTSRLVRTGPYHFYRAVLLLSLRIFFASTLSSLAAVCCCCCCCLLLSFVISWMEAKMNDLTWLFFFSLFLLALVCRWHLECCKIAGTEFLNHVDYILCCHHQVCYFISLVILISFSLENCSGRPLRKLFNSSQRTGHNSCHKQIYHRFFSSFLKYFSERIWKSEFFSCFVIFYLNLETIFYKNWNFIKSFHIYDIYM